MTTHQTIQLDSLDRAIVLAIRTKAPMCASDIYHEIVARVDGLSNPSEVQERAEALVSAGKLERESCEGCEKHQIVYGLRR